MRRADAAAATRRAARCARAAAPPPPRRAARRRARRRPAGLFDALDSAAQLATPAVDCLAELCSDDFVEADLRSAPERDAWLAAVAGSIGPGCCSRSSAPAPSEAAWFAAADVGFTDLADVGFVPAAADRARALRRVAARRRAVRAARRTAGAGGDARGDPRARPALPSSAPPWAVIERELGLSVGSAAAALHSTAWSPRPPICSTRCGSAA